MKKKSLWIVTPLIICLLVFLGVHFFLNHEDKDTALTILEKRWIENNSQTKVNLDLINDVAVLANSGTGVIFDFTNDFELETELEFNKIPYSKTSSPSSNELQFRLLSSDTKLTSKDLLLYEDGYVILGKENKRYDYLSEIKGKTIATLTSDMQEVTYYMRSAENNTYKPYETIDAMIAAYQQEEVELMVVPLITYLDKTLPLKDTVINYYFTELSKKYVLTLTENNDKLNSIVQKYFINWKKNRYVESYNKQLLSYYTQSKNMIDKVKVDMLSKTYIYGYVENAPYEVKLDKKVLGIAGEYIERIQRLTGIDIQYKSYKTDAELKNAIKNKEVDIYFNKDGMISSNYQTTISPFVEEYVVLGNYKIGQVVTSFESLKGKAINVLDTNVIYNYLKDNSKASITPKTSLDKLKEDNKLIVLDKETYEYYKTTKFKRYEVLYTSTITQDYNFGIKNDNQEFYKLFNYIITTNSYHNYRNLGLDSLNVSLIERTTFAELYLIILGLILLPILIIVLIYLYMKKKKNLRKVTKEERRKYTDMLTSLKNRNYLNFNMENWENTKVYPQGVIVVDLNNVSYVNDNYGHEEGDKLIVKAASILVNTQLENSEIMRTDGNEFLIYMIGYSEKQIATYVSKLTKELKELPHGFGAAVGYSIIQDDIKTLDDAINEASLDMRTKKEESR